MDPLTGKAKRHLRAIGQSLAVSVTIGKAGSTAEVTAQIRQMLGRRELIKVRMPAGGGPARKAMAAQLAGDAEAVCVGVVGRTALLYRPNEALDAGERIDLP